VLATVLNLLIVLLGVISFQNLTVREYPNIETPAVTVSTIYPGASASIVETQITNRLEDSLSGVEGVDFMSSISRSEMSQVTLQFDLSRDADVAAADVRDRVARVRSVLPREVEEPIVQKQNADEFPIIYLSLSSDRYSHMEMTEISEQLIVDQLKALPGVATIRYFGGRVFAMRIWLDRERLAAYGLTPQDVEAALQAQNLEVPSGRIESVDREFTVLAVTDLQTPEQFSEIILKDSDGYLVRLADVALVELGPEDERQLGRSDGNPAITIGVIKQSTANPLDIGLDVRRAIPRIKESLPEGVNVKISFDMSLFVEQSIQRVYITIGEAILLVAVVIFLFLQTARAAVIPLVTIPIALVGAFGIMSLFGFTINTLTLLAFVLAIGLVVDDAIVMLENIYRHIEKGMEPFEAALKGSREIGFAVLAMTTTLAAVFVPVAFTSGRMGKLFTEFAWTLAGAVVVSGFTALTLTPVLCAYLLRRTEKKSVLERIVTPVLKSLNRAYLFGLAVLVRYRTLVAIGVAIIAGAGLASFASLKTELAPIEDRSILMGYQAGPDGATPEYMDNNARAMEEIMSGVPEVLDYMTLVGFPETTQNASFGNLLPHDERSRSQMEITQELMPKFFAIPGVMSFPVNMPPLGKAAPMKPIQIVVQTVGSYDDLQALVDGVEGQVQGHPMIRDLDSDLKLNKPELRTYVDRDKAASVGVSVATIGRTLEIMLGGRKVTRFKRGGEQYEVIIQVADVDRSNPKDLSRTFVRAKNGDMVPLANLVRVEETAAPRQLNHWNRLRAVTFDASPVQGAGYGEAMDELERIIRDVAQTTIRIDYKLQSREFKEASGKLAIIFVMALAFIYLVLAAQFESFVDPFIILFSVPLALAGALLTMRLTGHTLNVYSQVGLITLVGLISKHGILIVEFANQLRRQGKVKLEAVIEAAVLRLRPILMTTGAMVLGAVPLAIATGAGAEARREIGVVIVGGLLFGSFFTLFVVPTIYLLLSQAQPSRAKAISSHVLAK